MLDPRLGSGRPVSHGRRGREERGLGDVSRALLLCARPILAPAARVETRHPPLKIF